MDKLYRRDWCKTAWIECECFSRQHALRMSYWEEKDGGSDELFLDFGVSRLPKTDTDGQPYCSSTWKYKKEMIKQYFRAIWWTIRGRPLWWSAEISISHDGAKKIVDSLKQTMLQVKQ